MHKKLQCRVQLPIEIPYDFIIGGACRDRIGGISFEHTKDFDLVYVGKHNYIKVLTTLMNKGFVNQKSLAYNDYGIDVIFSRWKKKRMKQYFDLFFLDCDKKGAMKFINSFPLTCSTCYQKEGGFIMATDKALKDIREQKIEVNNKSVPLSILFERVNKLSKNGWTVGSTVVDVFLKKMELIMKNAEKFRNEEYRYIKVRSSAYFTAYKVRSKLIKDFISLLNEDNRVLAFLARNNKILKAVQKQYNRDMWWKKMLNKIKKGD